MKKAKLAYLHSLLALLVCISMFIGSTFAWFTDSVSTVNNIITSGNLDLEMYWTDDLNSNVWYNVEDPAYNTIFNYDNWEPGYTEVKYIKLVNAGSLALNYQLTFTPTGAVGKLAEVIGVYYANDGVALTSREDLANLNSVGFLSTVMNGGATANGTLLAKDENSPLHSSGEVVITLAMSMITTAGNEYQNESIGDGFTITALATQCAYEPDAFGPDYDGSAEFPEVIKPSKGEVSVTPVDGKVPSGGLTVSGGGISAEIPEGVLLDDGVEKLTVSVTPLEKTTSDITVVNQEILIPVDVHVEGVSDANTVPIIIDLGMVLPRYLNMGNYRLYHVENGTNTEMTLVDSRDDLTTHNRFTYDSNTGAVTVAMATFSEVALVADTGNVWEGNYATSFAGGSGTAADPYIIANADQLAYLSELISNDNANYAEKSYKLISNIDFGGSDNGHVFYPIGCHKAGSGANRAGETEWYTYGGAFSGTFDGAGHTITGIYQNTWVMDGNYNNGYWNEAMGLFGYIKGGTVRNLTIDNFYSEGEFAPTGCVTACAEGSCTFENIAITNSHPQTYNTGVAGIVGWDEGSNSKYTFKNITVAENTTISALWGSWDVAAAGIMGYLGPNSTAELTNCNLSPTIDVYNDVCGNYQYYWYRYCGMVIGTVDKRKDNGKGALDLSNIEATNCKVNFGDRHEYYYCEFEKNTQASYTEDYQFSRVPHSELNMDENPITCKHTHTAKEDKQAIHIPFRQLFGGYGWGVDGVDLGEYSYIDILDVTTSEEKFKVKFPNADKYLYRVGTQNEVSLSSLFEAIEGKDINDSGVYVSITALHDNTKVMGTFTSNTENWANGKVHFKETGPVKVTIQDYQMCTPTVLCLEVIDATNITKSTSVGKNQSVVLLNDISGGFTVDGGAFYGNGFTVTCAGNGAYSSKALSFGFVTVKNGGVLDNAQIKCDIFPESYLYTREMIADSSGKYPYAYSAVVISGNSTISNCYIYGARNNIYVGEGNVTIRNTVNECGSLSNIQMKSTDAYTVTLDNVTTIQKLSTSEYDSSKKILGFGVLVGDNESDSNPKINLTGELKQYNWVSEADANQVSNTYAQQAIKGALEVTDYQHKTSDGTTVVNTGIAYLNEKTATVDDNRSNKDSVPYKLDDVQILTYTGQVYSIVNGGTVDGDYEGFNPSQNTTVPASVTYADSTNGLTFETKNSTTHTLTVDLDTVSGGTYSFDFNQLKIEKYGKELTYTVKNADGTSVSKDTPIALNGMFTGEYVLTVSDDQIYDQNGTLTGTTEVYPINFTLKATKTSIEPPKFTNAGTATAIRLVTSKGGDWRPAYTALTGVSVTYWSASESKVKTVDLSTLYKSGTSSSNIWTYTCDDYTLTITGGAVHSDGTTITPVVANNTLYFASTNKAFGTGTTSRDIILTYVFTDKNASTTWNRKETVTYSNLSEYDYNSFKNNGTLTEPSSGGGTCLAAGTMITMADGTKRAVEDLRKGDSVMAFDHLTGTVTANDVIIVVKTQSDFYENTFVFDDGTEMVTINEHGIFDLDLNCYVNIDRENAAEFIGHNFVSIDPEGNIGSKKLVDVVSEYTAGYKYDIVTEQTLNYVAEDTLSVTHVLVDIINTFAFGENLCYDAAEMQEDIAKYGLYTYEEWEPYADISVFEEYNIPVMKIGVEKGLYTKAYIIYLINTYVLDESVQIV